MYAISIFLITSFYLICSVSYILHYVQANYEKNSDIPIVNSALKTIETTTVLEVILEMEIENRLLYSIIIWNNLSNL